MFNIIFSLIMTDFISAGDNNPCHFYYHSSTQSCTAETVSLASPILFLFFSSVQRNNITLTNGKAQCQCQAGVTKVNLYYIYLTDIG